MKFRIFARLILTQLRADAGQQHDEAERLADIVVGAGIETAHGVGVQIVRGQHNDRPAIAIAAYPLDSFASVEIGQPNVHDDEVRRRFRDRLERRLRRLNGLNVKLGVQSELLDQRVTQVGIIVHDQQSPRFGHRPYFIDSAGRRLAQDCGEPTAAPRKGQRRLFYVWAEMLGRSCAAAKVLASPNRLAATLRTSALSDAADPPD